MLINHVDDHFDYSAGVLPAKNKRIGRKTPPLKIARTAAASAGTLRTYSPL